MINVKQATTYIIQENCFEKNQFFLSSETLKVTLETKTVSKSHLFSSVQQEATI